jgi:hypothetical protein
MKRQLTLIILLISFFSCAAQKKEIISKSTIKLEGQHTKIRDLLDIDGYYDVSQYSRRNIMFFEDGTYVWNFFFKTEATKKQIEKNMFAWIDSWIKHEHIGWGGNWGVFRIESDTIIGHSFVKGTFLTAWSFDEDRYKIIDRQTIKKIYWKPLLYSDEEYKKYNTSPWLNDDNLYHFVSADSLPPSDCWLKEEKWIWRHESDWKNYMEKIKQKKNKK